MSVLISNTTDEFQTIPILYTDDFEAYSVGSISGQGDWLTARGTVNIVDYSGNKVYHPNTSGYALAYYNKTFSDDQRSKATVKAIAVGVYVGVCVRCDSNGQNYYLYYVTNTSRYLECRSGDTAADMASVGTGGSVDDILEITVEGNTITCYRNGSVDTGLGDGISPTTGTAGVYTDTRVPSGGKPGICGLYNSGSYGDTWEGGNY